MKKPELLFISPTVPAKTGHGSAMRAGVMLEWLSTLFNIRLVVYDLYGINPESLGATREWCAESVSVNPWGNEEAPWTDMRFDAIHVFRLATVPFAGRYFQGANANTWRVLDLDDYESQTRFRFAKLAAENGDFERARAERESAESFERAERTAIPSFDRVFVCSEDDRRRLYGVYPRTRFSVVPNAIRLPEAAPPPALSASFTILFVGTMNYYPNEDAAVYFCNQVLPVLRRRVPGILRLFIVGSRPTPRVRALALLPGVRVTGHVKELPPFYKMADLVVAPLRAGGGTRLKILEAFSYRRPVVSTSMGAEGLGVRSGEQLLIADDAKAFADRCLELVGDAAKRNRLAARGYEWALNEHSVERLSGRIPDNFPRTEGFARRTDRRLAVSAAALAAA